MYQRLVRRVDDSPGQRRPKQIEVNAAVQPAPALSPLGVDDLKNGTDRAVGPADLRLHARLDDVQRVEDG